MAEIKTNSDGIGVVQIADEVIAIIAGTAALEIEGVAGMAGNLTGDIAEILGRKNLSKGVVVEVNEDRVTVSLSLLLKFGYKIQAVSCEVQQKVKTAVETMTGLDVAEINVHITGVHMDKDRGIDSYEDLD